MRKNNSLNIWILNNFNFWGSRLIRHDDDDDDMLLLYLIVMSFFLRNVYPFLLIFSLTSPQIIKFYVLI